MVSFRKRRNYLSRKQKEGDVLMMNLLKSGLLVVALVRILSLRTYTSCGRKDRSGRRTSCTDSFWRSP